MAFITYSVEEAAEVLKTHRTTVLDLIDSGELGAAKVGKSWCIPEDEVRALVQRRIEEQLADRRAARERTITAASTISPKTLPPLKRARREPPALPDL